MGFARCFGHTSKLQRGYQQTTLPLRAREEGHPFLNPGQDDEHHLLFTYAAGLISFTQVNPVYWLSSRRMHSYARLETFAGPSYLCVYIGISA